MPSKIRRCRVVVVGAGAAGVGVGVALQHAGIDDFVVLDRFGVGGSFDRWPKEMRFISPSFPTNSIGMLDLNAVAVGTSPAYTLGREHPSGREYARYLKAVAEFYDLPVVAGVEVERVEHDRRSGGFSVHTAEAVWRCRYLVWAAGEFQYPRVPAFPGAELGVHNARVASWADWPAGDAVIIGGYESGIDAAVHLAGLGKRVVVLERRPVWESDSSDPSVTLSTYTAERLALARETGRVELVGDAEVAAIRRQGDTLEVVAADGRTWKTAAPPVLAVGFEGSYRLVEPLFDFRDDGLPELNDRDESTRTPNLFLVGPGVRHGNHVFCFIFKFRQRFAVVARAITDRLGIDSSELEGYRAWGMFLDDLSCCGQECVC